MDDTFKKKIRRLKTGRNPVFIDLFSGCGGISLGFARAGFSLLGSIEMDEWAARSHALNFFRHQSEAKQAIHASSRDITRLEPEAFVKEMGYGWAPEMAVDVIVGGPPCQAFARVGRAKLREVAEHPEAFRHDPRSRLYIRFLDYVKTLKPLAILMENVPDVLNHAGTNIAEVTCEILSEWGYDTAYTLLNAVNFGVPQMRERMFLIALAKPLRQEVRFPAPTHWYALPRGYLGSRQVALKNITPTLFETDSHYRPAKEPDRSRCLPAVTVREALADLPPITVHLGGGLKRGARRFTDSIPYPEVQLSDYAEMMREWPGFKANGGVRDHVIRTLSLRDERLFKAMKPGDQYPEAYALAGKLFEAHLESEARHGVSLREGTPAMKAEKKKFVPPYDPNKFPNKWRKMEPDQPARTLMAHLGKDSYSHIHYDGCQARTISVREAARLQSFPDGFLFEGTMNPAFRQIGNAVPPLLAYALASEIWKALP